jgi:hypothetical protein
VDKPKFAMGLGRKFLILLSQPEGRRPKSFVVPTKWIP